MQNFPDIDRVNDILDEIADNIPNELYKGLSSGIVLLESSKTHEQSLDNDLYILGEYFRSGVEKQIIIYYGSLKKVYPVISEEKLKEKLKDVLIHELTHHLEHRAGIRDLEIEDRLYIKSYKEKYNVKE